MKIPRLILSFVLFLLLSSCGQIGPLYLPAAQTHTAPTQPGY